jgi:ribosome-binding factor A
MGDEKTAALTMHGLTSAKGYLQSKVAEYIKSRYTPELRFVLDDTVLKSVQTSAILRDVLPSEDTDDDVSSGAMEHAEEPSVGDAGYQDL